MVVKAREKDKYRYFDISRKSFYKYTIDILDSFGLDGQVCLLRTICEIAEFPMHIKEQDTILERIIHFIFTPSLDMSNTTNGNKNKQKLEYKLLLAERSGTEGKDCEEEYSDCIVSLVDLFTNKYLL
ncbi:unnamed protein product [Callosobruchus maculatus]|nr:unnamed protein product [Callosobruchus maculatus]